MLCCVWIHAGFYPYFHARDITNEPPSDVQSAYCAIYPECYVTSHVLEELMLKY